jgi:hypothetical protein
VAQEESCTTIQGAFPVLDSYSYLLERGNASTDVTGLEGPSYKGTKFIAVFEL